MCHILWMLPILGLPLFWIFDFWVALPLYLGLLAITGVMMLLTVEVLKKPASSGIEAMYGDTAEVVEALKPRGRVRYHNQLWYATARAPVEVGETVRIVGNRGLCLLVEKCQQGQETAAEAAQQCRHLHLVQRG